MNFRPLTNVFGAQAVDADLSQPVDSATFHEIKSAWLAAGVLIFRGQSLTPAEQISFCRRFGGLIAYTQSRNALAGFPEILVLSNAVENGTPVGAAISGRYWHTDGHFLLRPPSASILYGLETPAQGGETWFADMRAAHDALPESDKEQIAGRKVIISRVRSRPYNYPDKPPVTDQERAEWVDMPQPMVRTHPETGRKALYIGGNVPWRVEGMSEDQSNVLIPRLQAFSVQPEFCYVHSWRPGDLIIWDNRSVIHKATDYDMTRERRRMHRVTIAGEEAF